MLSPVTSWGQEAEAAGGWSGEWRAVAEGAQRPCSGCRKAWKEMGRRLYSIADMINARDLYP